MKEFKAAAEADVEGEEAQVLEFSLAGQEFVANKASTGQIALVVAAMDDDGGAKAVAAVFRFLSGILQDDGYQRLRDLVAKGVVPLDLLAGGDDDNEEGIVEWIIEKSIEERPTKRPTDYLPSQGNGGQRSTGRSRGAGSMPSSSVRAAS